MVDFKQTRIDLIDGRISLSQAMLHLLVADGSRLPETTRTWLQKELDGYNQADCDNKSLPDYRLPIGQLVARHQSRPDSPIQFASEADSMIFQIRPICFGVEEIESIVARHSGSPIEMTLSHSAQAALIEGVMKSLASRGYSASDRLVEGMTPIVVYAPSQFVGILTKIKVQFLKYLGEIKQEIPDPQTNKSRSATKRTEQEGESLKIFISHASTDKALIDSLVDLLQTGLNIREENILCTSLEGMGIPPGKNFVTFLREQLAGQIFVIAVITENYYKSAFCLCELGAAWIKDDDLFPILVPPLDYKDLQAVLFGMQVAKINKREDLNRLKDKLTTLMLSSGSTGRWEGKRDAFLIEFESLNQSLQSSETLASKEMEDSK